MAEGAVLRRLHSPEISSKVRLQTAGLAATAIQTGTDSATLAPMKIMPTAAERSTNPAIIFCNPHAKHVMKLLVMRGKNMAALWLKFVSETGLLGR